MDDSDGGDDEGADVSQAVREGHAADAEAAHREGAGDGGCGAADLRLPGLSLRRQVQEDSGGQAHTGLNPAIQLKEGEYIPTLAELYLICLNRRAINAAMRFVGGQELSGWYWSSTESSATYAWILNLYNGSADYYTKATYTRRVRPVSAFLHR